ncbi:retrotransposon protein, putative, unclassified [Tanacetum coccineum]
MCCDDAYHVTPRVFTLVGCDTSVARSLQQNGVIERKNPTLVETLTAMASEHFSLGPGPQLLTPGTLSSGLVPNPLPQTPVYAPSPSTSQTPQETQPLVIPSGVEEEFHDIKVAHLDNDPFFGVPIPEPHSKESSSRDVIPTNVHSINQPPEHLSKWTKDHPLNNIEATQEELNDFECLEVWELVPRPDHVMIITLKWIFKVLCLGSCKTSLLPQTFSKRTVDPTLFTRKEGKDILLVQIYVDDIIFASTDPALCETFSKIMSSKFKMSMMGKMSFFLGLQISQSPKGIFLNQSKYAFEIIKKYGMETSDPVDTLMVEKSKLDVNPQRKEVDPHVIVE